MSRASCSKATGEEAPHFFLLGMRLPREVGLSVVLTAAAKTTCGPVWPLTTRAASWCRQAGQSPCGAWRGGYGCSRSFLVPCAEGRAGWPPAALGHRGEVEVWPRVPAPSMPLRGRGSAEGSLLEASVYL